MSDARGLPKIEPFPDPQALAQGAAGVLAEAIDRRLCDGAKSVGFVTTGGKTPVGVYEALHDWPLDWGRVAVTLSDERFVPPSSPDSNEGLVRQHLLKGAAAAASFTPLWSEAPNPDEAARRAEPAIRELLPFDVVLLGVGPDGHIASLFPHSPALAEGLDPDGQRLVIGSPPGTTPPLVPRITLTLRALLESRLIVVLTQGREKRQILEKALGGADLPLRAVLDQHRTPVRILWAE